MNVSNVYTFFKSCCYTNLKTQNSMQRRYSIDTSLSLILSQIPKLDVEKPCHHLKPWMKKSDNIRFVYDKEHAKRNKQHFRPLRKTVQIPNLEHYSIISTLRPYDRECGFVITAAKWPDKQEIIVSIWQRNLSVTANREVIIVTVKEESFPNLGHKRGRCKITR